MRLFAAVGLAFLIMLPRLGSPQFGLLDDGLTLQTGHALSGRWSSVLHLIPETGRFFPAYWLVYSVIVSIVGVRPLGFFAVNVLLLAGLVAILVRLVRLGGGTRRQAGVAAVLFALSGPAVEAFYTLSKAEPWQLTWIGLSLLFTAASAIDARWATRAALIVLAGAALLLAHATKETSLILLPIALGWLAIERWSPNGGPGARFAATYVAINLLAASAFVALRWYYAPLGLGEGTYTRAYSLDPATVGAAGFRVSAWLLRDFAFLLPLLGAALLPRVGGGSAGRRVTLFAGVWMIGWLAVYLPWPATFEYYLLPFAFGAAVLGGTVIGHTWQSRGRQHSAATRRAASSLLGTSALLWLVTLVNAAADARVQLAVDRANTDLVDFLAGLPTHSRVVLNTDRVNEYLFELPLHLAEIKRRTDIVVEHIAGATLGGSSTVPIFLVTGALTNKPGPTVRVGLGAVLAQGGTLVYRAGQHIDLTEIGIHRLLCHVSTGRFVDRSYCPGDRGLIDRRTFSYGWQVHRLGRPPGGDVEIDHGG